MGISWVPLLVVAALLILLFGRGRISPLTGDVARGITSFRQGLKEGAEAPASEETSTTIEGETVDSSSDKK